MDDDTYLNREGKRVGAPIPSLSVAVKLGSIAVHVEEMLSPTRHRYDVSALSTILEDAELRAWLDEMGKLALLEEVRPVSVTWVLYGENYYQRSGGFAEVYAGVAGMWFLRVWKQFKSPDKRTGNTGRMMFRGSFAALDDAFAEGDRLCG